MRSRAGGGTAWLHNRRCRCRLDAGATKKEKQIPWPPGLGMTAGENTRANPQVSQPKPLGDLSYKGVRALWSDAAHTMTTREIERQGWGTRKSKCQKILGMRQADSSEGRYFVLLPRPAAGSRTFWLKLSSSEGTQYHSESTVRPLGNSIL